MKFGPYSFEVKNLDKVFYPEANVTKGDVIDYYERIADYALPYMKNRPLVMQRFPDGLKEEGFYNKQVPEHFPEWIDTVSVERKEEGDTQELVVCNNKATLVYLADQACLTPHLWLSTIKELDKPDMLIFDLDPPKNDFTKLINAAEAIKELMIDLGLKPFIKTTGSKGYHVVIPIKQELVFDEVRGFARKIGEELSKKHDEFTIEQRKKKRGGRVFIDYLRNSYAQTSVAPYSLRPRSGAPVVTPISWDELNEVKPQDYTIKNVFKRLSQKKNPWKDFFQSKRSLKRAINKL